MNTRMNPANVARGVAIRLGIVAVLWGSAALRLALLGWPWALGGADAKASALAVAIGLALGGAQGWFIAVRSGSRIVRWSREAATSRRMDALLVGRGLVVIAAFAGLGLTIRHLLLESHPVFVGGVYVLASTSLVVASLGLVVLAVREVRDARADRASAILPGPDERHLAP
jgi:hypothetical protein